MSVSRRAVRSACAGPRPVVVVLVPAVAGLLARLLPARKAARVSPAAGLAPM